MRAYLLRRLDALPDALPELASWLPAAVALGIAPGVALFGFGVSDRHLLLGNQLTLIARLHGMALSLASLALVLVVHAVVQRRARRRGQPEAPALRRTNALLSPLALLPVLAWLSIPGIEVERPELVLLLLAGAGAVMAVFAYHLPARLHELSPPRWLAPVLLGAAALAYAALLSRLALRQHAGLDTRLSDLGIYDNVVWNTSRGRLLATTLLDSGTHATSHFDPVLLLVAPLYWVLPGARTLLVLQSVWLALGAVPLFLLARKLTGRPMVAVALSLAYLMHPALHGANLYDFHSLTLAIPPILTALWLLETGRLGLFFANLALLLLIREDVALLMSLVGVHVAVGRRQPRLGAVIIAACAAYYVALKLLVMHTGLLNDGVGDSYHSSYTFYYKALIPAAWEGTGGLLASLLANPLAAVAIVFTEAKLEYLLLVFLPMLGLPLLTRGRVMLAMGLVATLLASRPAMSSIYFQYVTLLLPIGFALTAAALASPPWRGLDERRATAAAAAAMVVIAAGMGARFGALLPNGAVHAGFAMLQPPLGPEESARSAWLEEKAASVPRTDSVAATARLIPHLTARDAVGKYPDRRAQWLFYEPEPGTPAPDPARYARVAAEHGIQVWRARAPP